MCHIALRSLNGYIRYVRTQQQGRQEFGDQATRDEKALYLSNIDLPNQP